MLELDTLFGRHAPRYLEIGCGAGETLAALTRLHPDNDYLGIEVYRPGVGRLLQRLVAEELNNARLFSEDAVAVLEHRLEEASLDGVYIFFPDPWPKKRHHKRRLIRPEFAALVASRLKPGGILHIATDWEDYARHILATLSVEPLLVNTADGFAPRPDYRPLTKFENRGVRLGHEVWDIIFRRLG